jgi:hypothetical protein
MSVMTLSVKYQNMIDMVTLEMLYHSMDKGLRGDGTPRPHPLTICITKNRAY